MAGECAFCAVVTGTSPAEFVLQDADVAAFLDNRPLFPGHVLVVPRQHVETFRELPDSLVSPLFFQARRLATAMETGLSAAGSFVAMNNRVSQSVPHLHVHVVPRNRKDGLRGFFWPRKRYRDAGESAEVARQLRDALEALPS